MKKKSYKRKKGPVQSKKISYDGINFASGLERYMYMALKKAKIKALYEGETFELQAVSYTHLTLPTMRLV